MSTRVNTILLIALLLLFILLGVVFYLSLDHSQNIPQQPVVPAETAQEMQARLLMESQPGAPVDISPEDQKRLEQEGKAGSGTSVKVDEATAERLRAEAKSN